MARRLRAARQSDGLPEATVAPFTVMVGELDTMYGSYERNQKFKEQIEQLRGGRADDNLEGLKFAARR